MISDKSTVCMVFKYNHALYYNKDKQVKGTVKNQLVLIKDCIKVYSDLEAKLIEIH